MDHLSIKIRRGIWHVWNFLNQPWQYSSPNKTHLYTIKWNKQRCKREAGTFYMTCKAPPLSSSLRLIKMCLLWTVILDEWWLKKNFRHFRLKNGEDSRFIMAGRKKKVTTRKMANSELLMAHHRWTPLPLCSGPWLSRWQCRRLWRSWHRWMCWLNCAGWLRCEGSQERTSLHCCLLYPALKSKFNKEYSRWTDTDRRAIH